jgi:hypothetical protein
MQSTLQTEFPEIKITNRKNTEIHQNAEISITIITSSVTRKYALYHNIICYSLLTWASKLQNFTHTNRSKSNLQAQAVAIL